MSQNKTLYILEFVGPYIVFACHAFHLKNTMSYIYHFFSILASYYVPYYMQTTKQVLTKPRE